MLASTTLPISTAAVCCIGAIRLRLSCSAKNYKSVVCVEKQRAWSSACTSQRPLPPPSSCWSRAGLSCACLKSKLVSEANEIYADAIYAEKKWEVWGAGGRHNLLLPFSIGSGSQICFASDVGGREGEIGLNHHMNHRQEKLGCHRSIPELFESTARCHRCWERNAGLFGQ